MTDHSTDSSPMPMPTPGARDTPTTVAALLAASPLPPVDTRVLLCHALGWRRTELITRSDAHLATLQIDACQALIARRLAGEPVAQLVGSREFFGRNFIVTPAVLIPRPDTELLVELALDAIDARATAQHDAPIGVDAANAAPVAPIQVLDLGTGSGAIAVTLAAERPTITIHATDRSTDALQIAQRNADVLLANGRIQFAQGDWFAALDEMLAQTAQTDSALASGIVDGRFDVIVSNPPYIAAQDPHLTSGDLRFEPPDALSDGADGLSDLRHIAEGSGRWLKPGGHLLMEHGYDQGLAVRQIVMRAGFSDVRTMQDLSGHERVTLGIWPSQCP